MIILPFFCFNDLSITDSSSQEQYHQVLCSSDRISEPVNLKGIKVEEEAKLGMFSSVTVLVSLSYNVSLMNESALRFGFTKLWHPIISSAMHTNFGIIHLSSAV